MKKLLFFALICTSTFAKAQSDLDVLPLQNGKIAFSRSSDALGTIKDTLFARGKYWMANNISMSMAIQSADNAAGVITGTGSFLLKLKGGNFSKVDNRFDFRVQINCSDGQYSFSIDNLTFTQLNADGNAVNGAIPLEVEAKTSKANANAINMKFENIYFSLIDAMSNAAVNSKAVSSYTLTNNASVPATSQEQNTVNVLPETDGKITYESIVDIPNKNADFIFNAANKWIIDNYSGKTGGILSEDKDQGQILAKGSFALTTNGTLLVAGNNYTYVFNIQIDCKDNRYRIKLYNMFYGSGVYDRNLIDLEYYNNTTLKGSKSDTIRQNAYNLDAQFKAVMQSLADAVNKAAKDDF